MQDGQGALLGHPCPNCGTLLLGPWCYACGQKGGDHHRSLRHLVLEASEGLTHADGRLWTTWRGLITHPGRLTRDYLNGKRAPQVPPFRLFLIGVVILLLAGPIGNLGPNKTHVRFADPNTSRVLRLHITNPALLRIAKPASDWLYTRMGLASKSHQRALAEMEHWAHYAAISMILVAAPLLSIAFARQRKFYFYDHLIFSMHSLAFQAVLLSVALMAGGWLMAAWLVVLFAPVHLFFHMRGVYGTSAAGTLTRMLFLLVGSALGFVVLLALLVIVGLSAET